MKALNRSFGAGWTIAVLSCGIFLSAASGAVGSTLPADSLVTRLSTVENFMRLEPWLLTGGQPDAAALATLADAGVVDVFDLRTPGESRGFDERAVVRGLGLRYKPIPTGPENFSDSRFTAFRHHLIASGPKRPRFFHCGSGNRVGAALLPWLVLDRGMEEEAALDLAKQMGLRDPFITQRALDYIQARQIAPRE